MMLSGYSQNHQISIEKDGNVLRIKPSAFKQFIQEVSLPDFVAGAIPGHIRPDVNSDNPNIAMPTWLYLMTLYFDVLGETAPYSFFASEVEDEEESGDYIY